MINREACVFLTFSLRHTETRLSFWQNVHHCLRQMLYENFVMKMTTFLFINRYDKRKGRHFDKFVISVQEDVNWCQNDNFQCRRWWKFRQNDNIFASVHGDPRGAHIVSGPRGRSYMCTGMRQGGPMRARHALLRIVACQLCYHPNRSSGESSCTWIKAYMRWKQFCFVFVSYGVTWAVLGKYPPVWNVMNVTLTASHHLYCTCMQGWFLACTQPVRDVVTK